MRVIDYKDGIKGEAPRLLLMCEKEYCLTRHYEYEPSEHITNDLSYLFGTELMDTVTHFPQLYLKETQPTICGLVDSMVYLGDIYNYMPKGQENLYTSLTLIRACDSLESLLSFWLAAKDNDSDSLLNQAHCLTASIVAKTEALLQDDEQPQLLEDRCTILDFAILGLYLACSDKDELREIVTCRLEQSPRLAAYLQRRVQYLLPILIHNGQHIVCHASGPYATVYWLLMSQARLPFEIVPSPEPYMLIANVKYTDIEMVLRTIVGVLGFETNDKSPLMDAALQLWATAPALWESTKGEQLEVVEGYFKSLGRTGLLFQDKARLEELYCIALRRDSDSDTCSRLLPTFYKYATEWLQSFTRKENCLLLLSNMPERDEPLDLESLLYATITFPFVMVDVLQSLGYKVEMLILGLNNYKERIASIKERPNYREGRLDIFNACDGTEFDGCTGMSVYKALDELEIKYAGCTYDALFNTTYKDFMKAIFTKAGIPTAPYLVMSQWDPTLSTEHMPYPLLIKPNTGFASVGLTKDAKCHDLSELEAAIKVRNKQFLHDNKFVVESFIQGREFTVMVVGSPSTELIVYDPVERVFNSNKAPGDRWLSYEERFNQQLYQYKKVVEPELADTLKDISKKSHVAVAGAGYGRTDLRQDYKTGQLYVLETNFPCGIGFKLPPYYILQMCGQRLEDFLALVIAKTTH